MYHFPMDTTWQKRAKALMQAYRISQADLAEALFCTRGAIGHYLSGRRTPNLDQLEAIATALQTDPIWLLYGEQAGAVHEASVDYGHDPRFVPLTAETERGKLRHPGHLSLPAAGCYAVLVNSDAYEPRIHPGEALLIDPKAKPGAGDEIIIQHHNGTVGLYLLIQSTRDHCSVGNITGVTNVHSLDPEEFKHMHKVIAIFRASQVQKN